MIHTIICICTIAVLSILLCFGIKMLTNPLHIYFKYHHDILYGYLHSENCFKRPLPLVTQIYILTYTISRYKKREGNCYVQVEKTIKHMVFYNVPDNMCIYNHLDAMFSCGCMWKLCKPYGISDKQYLKRCLKRLKRQLKDERKQYGN